MLTEPLTATEPTAKVSVNMMTREKAYEALQADLERVYGPGIGYLLAGEVAKSTPHVYAEKFDRAIVATKAYADRVGLP